MKYVCSLFLLLVILSSCIQEKDPEVVVIGGGLMGSAVAWQLARGGLEVLLLEKQDSAYASGSSFGEARIARSNNRGNDIWSYMHNSSVTEVAALISFLNQTYSNDQYDMSDIYTTSPVSYIGRSRIYEQLMSSLIRQGIDYKIATNYNEGKDLFNVILLDSVLLQREYNTYSGTINPERLIAYLHKGLKAKKGSVNYGCKVSDIHLENDFYRIHAMDVHTGKEIVIKTKKVVSAVGPYTGTLLKDIAPYFEELIVPQRVFLAFYKIRKESYNALSVEDQAKLKNGYPVINSSKGTRDGSFFSMIEYYDDDLIPVIKIGGHFQRSEIRDLDRVWEKQISASEKEWAFNNTISYFRLLDIPVNANDLIFDHGYSCVYSLTESEVPLVTPIPDLKGMPNSNFVVMGGMSGVGAKGAMTYGRIAADQMMGIDLGDDMYQLVRKALGFDRLSDYISK